MTRRWIHRPTNQEVAQLGGYDVLYADPPWQYRNKTIRGGAQNHYGTMSLGELCMLPVEDLAAPDAVLFMWGTWPTLPDAFGLMRAWGFRYYNCGLLWAKLNKVSDTPFFGQGHMTRGNTEPCLLGVRGKPKRADNAVEQLVLDNLVLSRIGEHSEKPAEARARIVQLMGEGAVGLEMFAREAAPGWDCFGDEVESTVVLEHKEVEDEEDPDQPAAA